MLSKNTVGGRIVRFRLRACTRKGKAAAGSPFWHIPSDRFHSTPDNHVRKEAANGGLRVVDTCRFRIVYR